MICKYCLKEIDEQVNIYFDRDPLFYTDDESSEDCLGVGSLDWKHVPLSPAKKSTLDWIEDHILGVVVFVVLLITLIGVLSQ